MKKIGLFLIAFLLCGTIAQGLAAAADVNPGDQTFPSLVFRAVDTMKESRDQANPDKLTADQKAQTSQLIASMHTTHVTVDTQYDFPEVMKAWIDAARAAGKNVWFRPNWSAWEGNNGFAADMTPQQYIDQTVAFIKAHSDYFQPGDIFDACPEPEQGKYWYAKYGQTWTDGAPNTATDEYNQFFVQLSESSAQAFESIGIQGVVTTIRSVNGWFAFTPAALYDSTVQTMGYVTTDSYPSQNVTSTPAVAFHSFQNEITKIHDTRKVPVVLGEFGWSTWGSTSEEKQAQILEPWFKWLQTLPWIAGINYWCGPGYSTTSDGNDGTTDKIFKGTTGNWSLNESGAALSQLFDNIDNGIRTVDGPFVEEDPVDNTYPKAFGHGEPYNGDEGSSYRMVFDNSTDSFFDCADASGCYAGLDYGPGGEKVVDKIQIYPRANWASRMVGGKFQGSNEGPDTGFIDLYTVTAEPAAGWNEIELPNTTAYRYYRYLSPEDGFANVAEVKFIATGNGGVHVYPEVFGLGEPYGGNEMASFNTAFDGKTDTFFDCADGSGCYAGIDYGPVGAKAVNVIRYYPRANWAARMVGGKFQGSNESSSQGFVDLYTITEPPQQDWNTAVISNATAYRYYRYVSPDGGYANVAEIAFSADHTPPATTVQWNHSPQNEWFNQPVTVSLSATDDLSGIFKTEFGIDNGTWQAYSAPVTVTNDGRHIFRFQSVDRAGNVEDQQTITINIDTVKPFISIPNVRNGVSYSDAREVVPQIEMKDLGSGVDSQATNIVLDGKEIGAGTTIAFYSLPLGSHTLTVAASDRAGNQSVKTISFRTITSVDSLKALIDHFAMKKWIDNAGIAKSLEDKLSHDNLNSFLKEVNAQSSKHITAEAANILLRDAHFLMQYR